MTSATPGLLDRTFALAGGDEPSTRGSKLLAFRRFLYMHLAVQALFRLSAEPITMWALLFVVLYAMCLLLGWFRRWTRSAGEIALLVALAQIVYTFPFTANHLYLESLILLFLALCDPAKDEDNDLALQGCRWLALLALFYSGLKKLMYGYYFDGTFLSHMVAHQERFAAFFQYLIPEEELVRLRSYRWPSDVGSGPFRVDSVAMVVVSNASYLLEMLLPIGLLIRRLRPLAWVASIGLVIAIELAAREIFFGALITNLLLLFATRDLNRKLLPLWIVLYLFLTAVAVGLVPRWGLT